VIKMYVALYDKTYKHIGNITDVKFDIVQRVYDFDSSSFSGIGERDFSEAFIFSFCEETGVQKYSGLVKNLSQQNNKITFKGEDLRILFDTDIILDFSNATSSDFVLKIIMKLFLMLLKLLIQKESLISILISQN